MHAIGLEYPKARERRGEGGVERRDSKEGRKLEDKWER